MDYVYEFDNIQSYYAECVKPSQSRHKSSATNSQTFCYSPSFEATQERYSKGFSEGTEQARLLMMKLTPYIQSVRGLQRGWKPQVYAGGNFILSNYVRGVPELCNVMSSVSSKKFCSIVYNQTASCGINTEVMLKRGVVAVALVQILERAGYRVAVKVAYAEEGYIHKLFTTVVLKAFNQTIDGDRLAFFLADPSSFRRLNFAFMESLPAPIPTDILDHNYGTPIDLPANMIGDKDIYFTKANFNDGCWQTLDGTIGYLRETLKRYGIVMT